ncbi:MAG: hypothetical protein AAGJ70_00200 [Pseudomonadota bacterium]
MFLIATVTAALLAFYITVAVVPTVRGWLSDPAQEPDGPESFGVGHAWIAVRSVDIDQVIATLGLTGVTPCNWSTGLAVVEDPQHSASYVFVTPPVDGWTFVVGLALPYPAGRDYHDACLALMLALGKRFDEVQYFYACPDVGLTGWARFAETKLRRAFAWGDEGVIWNRGTPDATEQALGLKVLRMRERSEARGAIDEDERGYPEALHAVQVAAGWSLDPETFSRLPGDPALGFLGVVPRTWAVRRINRKATITPPPVRMMRRTHAIDKRETSSLGQSD